MKIHSKFEKQVFSLKDVKRIQESLKKLEDLIPQKLNKDAISDLFRGVRNTVREWITHVSPPSLQLLNLTALLSQVFFYWSLFLVFFFF